MTITFFGHSDFYESEKYENTLLSFLEKTINGESVEFLLGGYGGFDAFAYRCSNKYKSLHKNTKLTFVTPYITEDYQKNHLAALEKEYDFILYPELEHVPKRFAITHRNRWMAEKADLVITYLIHSHGGAFQAVKYARGKGKRTVNLTEL